MMLVYLNCTYYVKKILECVIIFILVFCILFINLIPDYTIDSAGNYTF